MFTVRLCNPESAISAETDSFDGALSFIRDVTGCPGVWGAWESKEEGWEMAVFDMGDGWGPHEPSAIARILAAPGFVPPAGTTLPPDTPADSTRGHE